MRWASGLVLIAVLSFWMSGDQARQTDHRKARQDTESGLRKVGLIR